MSYKAILSTKNPTKEALDKYYEQKLRDIQYSVEQFYKSLENKALAKERERLQRKQERTLKKRISNETIKYKSAIKSLKTGDIVIKTKPRTVWQIKQKAFWYFQKYCRLLRADRQWMVRLLDTGELVHYTKAQWWHFYSKHNHPNLAFESINCRPISAMGNKLQWDQPWYYRKENLIERIWIEKFDDLEELSKETDNTIRDRKYWEYMEQVRKEAFEDLKNERIVNGRAV